MFRKGINTTNALLCIRGKIRQLSSKLPSLGRSKRIKEDRGLEIAPQLRVLTILTKDPGSVCRTHMDSNEHV